jgi:soluble lytic murein transglycosylase-like protein
MNRFIFLFAIIAFVAFANYSFCQAMYSYIDENGIQVFTNIPPVKRVYNLKVTGSPALTRSVDPSKPKSEKYAPIIEKYARDYQVDPSLIHSIIATESDFNPKAISRAGAQGLMQLMPATAVRLGVNNSFDPEQNIRGGVQHFRWLLDNFDNNLDLSLAAYNAGENLVQRLGRVPLIKETQDYVQSVTRRYGKRQLSARAQENAKRPQTFRFFDESGVLHLTNIPPLH